MKTQTQYLVEENIIETKLYGDINHNDVLKFIDDCIDIALKNKCYSWLIDYSNARYKLNTLEILNLPIEVSAKMDVLGEEKQKIRRAIVSITDKGDFIFLENAAANKGQNLRVFDTRGKAIEWLQRNPMLS
jgi:hypothetical protein